MDDYINYLSFVDDFPWDSFESITLEDGRIVTRKQLIEDFKTAQFTHENAEVRKACAEVVSRLTKKEDEFDPFKILFDK